MVQVSESEYEELRKAAAERDRLRLLCDSVADAILAECTSLDEAMDAARGLKRKAAQRALHEVEARRDKWSLHELLTGVPQTYGEALKQYGPDVINCPGHEWDNRRTVENTLWLIDRLYEMKRDALKLKLRDADRLADTLESAAAYLDPESHAVPKMNAGTVAEWCLKLAAEVRGAAGGEGGGSPPSPSDAELRSTFEALAKPGIVASGDLAKLLSPWVPVAERLPATPATVLVRYSAGGVDLACYSDAEGDWILGSDLRTLREHNDSPTRPKFVAPASITHWMPIPEPPKE